MNNEYKVQSRLSKQCNYRSLWKLVNVVDPNQGRCILENTSKSIKLCHVFPRYFYKNDEVLNCLEWNFDMRMGDLNLDSPNNVFPVGETLHEMFVTYRWILIPDTDTIQAFAESVLNPPHLRRQYFPRFENRTFKYRLIPTSHMKDVILRRRTNASDPDLFTEYTYPFDDFPMIESHIRPELVIAAVGHVLRNRKDDKLYEIWSKSEDLKEITTIYYYWSSRIGPEVLGDNTYCPIAASVSGTKKGRIFMKNMNYTSQTPTTQAIKECDSDSGTDHSTYSTATPPRRVRSGKLILGGADVYGIEKVENWLAKDGNSVPVSGGK